MRTCHLAAGIILAAGAGTRMHSKLPKVLHQIGGRSLVGHVITAVQSLEPEYLCTVVRHQGETVSEHIKSLTPRAVMAWQDDIPGTGRAAWCALQELDKAAGGKLTGPVLVTAGDCPLLRPDVLEKLVQAHCESSNGATLLTANLDDPTGYGRILRDENGQVYGTVEEKDATEEQRKLKEVNTSMYVFEADLLREALANLDTNNAQGEMYLTDVSAYAAKIGAGVGTYLTDDNLSIEGANDRAQLSVLGAELNRRICLRHMLSGVTIVDPASTWIDVDVQIAPDTTVLPFTVMQKGAQVGANCVIGPCTTLIGAKVEDGQVVRHCLLEDK